MCFYKKASLSEEKAYLADLNADCDSLSDIPVQKQRPSEQEKDDLQLEAFLQKEGMAQLASAISKAEHSLSLLSKEMTNHSPPTESEDAKQSKHPRKGKSFEKKRNAPKLSLSNRTVSVLKPNKVKKSLELTSLNDILCSQKGSRKYQELVKKMSYSEIDHLLGKIEITWLMKSRYGNYFCQNLFKFCSNKQILQLLDSVLSVMPKVALDAHGTHSLQKLISQVKSKKHHQAILASLSSELPNLVFVMV